MSCVDGVGACSDGTRVFVGEVSVCGDDLRACFDGVKTYVGVQTCGVYGLMASEQALLTATQCHSRFALLPSPCQLLQTHAPGFSRYIGIKCVSLSLLLFLQHQHS